MKKISASGIDVDVYGQGKLDIGGTQTELYLTGAGIRTKKVGFVTINVYAAASYVDHQQGIVAGTAIDDIKRTKARVLELTLLRDMSADQIRSGFADALVVNGVDVSAAHLRALLDKITALPARSVVTIAGLADGTWGAEQVAFELPTAAFASEGESLADDFWRVWFGKPIDQGMATLKAALTKPGAK